MSGSPFPMRPSYMDVTMACGASVDLPQIDVESPYATEGTEAHKQCSDLLGLGPNSKAKVDDVNVMRFVSYCRDLQRKTGKVGTLPPRRWFVEQPREHPRIKGLGGTADFVARYSTDDGKSVLHIVDYKHGVGQTVVALDNLQMMTYAAIWMLPETSLVRCTIIQPRDFHQHLEAIRTAEYTVDEIKAFESLIVDQLTNLEYNPGPQCAKCASKPWCDNLLSFVETNLL